MEGFYRDCSLLFDDDGRIYLIYGNMEICLIELKEDLSGPRPGGLNRVVIKDKPDEVYLGYEGAHLYKINGTYVAFFIHMPKAAGRSWIKLGVAHHMIYKLDMFVGARIGLFMYSTQKIGGEADFTDFVYRAGTGGVQ